MLLNYTSSYIQNKVSFLIIIYLYFFLLKFMIQLCYSILYMKWEKFLGTSRTSRMAFHSLIFIVDPTMNLMNRPHHEYGRRSVILRTLRVPKISL